MRSRLVFVFAAALVSHATASPAAEDASRGLLRKPIDRIVERGALASAVWGIEVRSLKSGALIYARNEGKSLTPASTLKLVTTAAALDTFGPDATLQTTVETAGRLDGMGRILGDVYLVGRGDPTLWGSSAETPITPFDRLAEALYAAGARRIEGRLVGHEGLFTGDRRGQDWTWGDLVWYYGAEVSALSFNNGAVHIKVSPGEGVGDPVVVDRNPVSAYYKVVSTATTSEAGIKSDLKLSRDLGTNLIQLSGTHPRGASPEDLFVAIEDPARFATAVFAEVLESKGIRVMGAIETSSVPLPPGLRVLAGIPSPPMFEILKGINQPSHNQRAEVLLRLLGHRVKGEGSAKAGHDAILDFLTRLQVPLEGVALHDGSGLSRSDLLTAHGIVGLLVAMDRHPHVRAFLDSLPVAGVDGTLKRRMRRTPAEGRIRAKTGSVRHAAALAGYATTMRGERLAFAILLDNHTADTATALAAVDDIALVLVGKK